MGLNLSNQQIGQELDLNKDNVQQMTAQLRMGIAVKKPKVRLTGEVECDEMYLIAGHKGQPKVVKFKGRKGRRRRLKAKQGRGTLVKESRPFSRGIQRGGEVVLQMLANVKQATIAHEVKSTITPGSLIFTDEYKIYARLITWGYQHKSVCHAKGEYARSGGWRRFSQSACQHYGRFLVPTSFLAPTTSRNFSSKTAAVSWLFRVRA